MSARLARLAFGSTARRTQTTVASASSRVARRAMSSTASHGAQVKSNDMPWIIGSTIVFLPAFLYLISPSGRKTAQLVHDDKHDYPTLKHEDEAPESAPEPAAAPEPEKAESHVLMTDDEGTVADVSSSIQAAKADDSPKDAQEPEQQNATIDAANSTPVEQSSEQNKALSEGAPANQQG